MTQAQGNRGRLAYQIETTYATVPTAPDLKLAYFISESIGEKVALVSSQVIRGNRNPTSPVRGNRDVSGSLSTELAPSLGTLLRAALGANTTTGAGSPYTHTMKIGTSLPSILFEKAFQDLSIYNLYLGLKVSKMTLNIKPDGFQSIAFDFMGSCEAQSLAYDGQSGNFTAGLTVTGAGGSTGLILCDSDGGVTGALTLINTTGNFVNDEAITDTSTGAAVANGTLGSASIDSSVTDPGHSPFDGFKISSILEGGASIATVTAVDMTLENSLDGNTYLIGGGGRRGSVNDGLVKVSGTLTAMFDSMTLYNKAKRFTESSLKVVYSHGTGAGTAGNEYLEILVPELVYGQETPVIEGPQGVMVKLPFEAYYANGAEASTMQIILKNAEATI